MKNKIVELAAMAAMAALAESLSKSGIAKPATVNKLPLTNKQKQKRKVAKLQKAARKITRKNK